MTSAADAVDIEIEDDCEELNTIDEDVNICDRETFGTSTSAASNNNHIRSSDQNRSGILYLSHDIGSRALSFSGPLLSVSVEFCLWVCLFVHNFEVKYLGNQRS